MTLAFLGRVLYLSLPSVLLSLTVFEGGLRLFGYTPYYLDGNAFIPSPNPNLVYELRPKFKGLYAGVPISINSHGFRGREVDNDPIKSGFRVVVVGDSIAFGQGIHEQETLAAQLERELRSSSERAAEVVNLGVPTYNTCQEYTRFKEYALPLQPSVAVVVYVDNDPDPPLLHIKDSRVISTDVRTGWFGDFMAELRKYSAVYNLVWTRWQLVKNRTLSLGDYREMLEKKFDADSPGWKSSRRCLAELIALAQTKIIRVVVIPFPALGGLAATPYPFERYIRTVCEAVRLARAECLDVTPALQQLRTSLTVSTVENHPSAAVYERVAEVVAKLIL